MRWLLWIILTLCPAALHAQSKTVLPHELVLSIEVEARDHVPKVSEMILITINGIYRRHITREQIIQPDFDGFNWSQLGVDTWGEERLDGELVKTFKRRMAIYPNRAGPLTIGAFTHNLTLTDENDEWFEHPITSEPVTIEVAPAPEDRDWWFPVKSLKISDQWSNAPDQLAPGEGVLRIIRIEALGVTPEMIPPMPELTSPSAAIFPHPEKRFVELSPQGPLSYAFWRWTIRPSNDTSTIVEPLSFDFFDTEARVDRTVTISAQRLAYGTVVPDAAPLRAQDAYPTPVQLPGWPFAVLAGVICLLGAIFALTGRRLSGVAALSRFRLLDPLAHQLSRAARAGDLALSRRTAAAILRREGPSVPRERLLSELDSSIFSAAQDRTPLRDFAKAFLRNR
ncbi:hypothetical protein CEP88_14490 [Roseobacter denitrificans]|uniref:BatD protein n=1 Tax=Roseobacter denitrificans (strain ATCC 33942 / OCh 114) TaxID=375451 RepID=Q16BU7_ROSDO|nr:BatD family protein [Roseobacter denitrificans]ABG30546.1 conserved hypothetical protein [Roseobacter denitrificans OCh 114]AVL53695.1 hypothetical protein CEP88_14490 [Roseobacter denitrificans]SFF73992.1 Oxygen tolerance [Roseobacter denitrificans OCh 114]